MDSHLTVGARLLNGFLSLMVFLLILVLAAVVVCLLLAAFGVF